MATNIVNNYKQGWKRADRAPGDAVNQPERRQRMNERTQTQHKARPARAPLFASPWLALFLLLRKEWLAPRSP